MLRLLAACAAASSVFAQSGVFDVRAYGAVGDGVTDDTGAVRKAAAALEGAGGGTLLFDAGYKFLTGAFNISSNTYMVVAGTILGQTDNTKYELIQPLPWYGGGQDAQESGQLEWGSLIRSYPGSTNVTITGGGVIDGQGEPWYSCINKPAAPCSGYSRPHLLLLYSTVGVVIHNITLQSSPAWTLHLANCTDVHVYNTTILSTGPNTDGVDIDCSQNVLVEDCYISTGDDVFAIKSGIDWLGRTYGRPSRDVLIRRIDAGTGHGLSIGSEMSAGVYNVTFQDITMNGTATGPRLKSQRGRGGVISDIHYKNISMMNVQTGISLTLNYHPGLPPTNASATPQMHNVTMEGVTLLGVGAQAKSGISIDGLPESVITGLQLVDVNVSHAKQVFGTCDYAQGSCSGVLPSCPPCLG